MVFDSDTYGVLIVSSSEKSAAFIRGLLSPNRFYPVVTADSSGQARRYLASSGFDIIIVNTPLNDEVGIELADQAAQDTGAAIMLLVGSAQYEHVSCRAEKNGIFAVSKPTSAQTLNQAIRLLCVTRERMKALERKNIDLKKKMDEIRTVNHAKWVLIEYRNMTEEQAHRFIEKKAMDRRMSKREAAEEIIKTCGADLPA